MARVARRAAFTLIELLIVVAVILVISFLAVAFYPDISGGVRAASAADRIQSWLLNAKMRAKRDGVPTGVRLITFFADPDPLPKVHLFSNQMLYVQQPDDYAVGRCTAVTTQPDGTIVANITPNILGAQYGGAGSEGKFEVQPADYFQLYSGGPVRQITAVGLFNSDSSHPNTTPLTLGSGGFPTSPLLGAASSPAVPTSYAASAGPNYRIIRQPRPLAGEPLLTLPENMGVDLTTISLAGNSFNYSNPPRRVNNVSADGTIITAYFEILFAPAGNVIGTGSQQSYNGQIYLWVRDLTALDIQADMQQGRPTIIAVQPLSGFIAAYPVAPTNVAPNDPFFYTKAGRSSGM